jgi:hypothetical protein
VLGAVELGDRPGGEAGEPQAPLGRVARGGLVPPQALEGRSMASRNAFSPSETAW